MLHWARFLFPICFDGSVATMIIKSIYKKHFFWVLACEIHFMVLPFFLFGRFVLKEISSLGRARHLPNTYVPAFPSHPAYLSLLIVAFHLCSPSPAALVLVPFDRYSLLVYLMNFLDSEVIQISPHRFDIQFNSNGRCFILIMPRLGLIGLPPKICVLSSLASIFLGYTLFLALNSWAIALLHTATLFTRYLTNLEDEGLLELSDLTENDNCFRSKSPMLPSMNLSNCDLTISIALIIDHGASIIFYHTERMKVRFIGSMELFNLDLQKKKICKRKVEGELFQIFYPGSFWFT